MSSRYEHLSAAELEAVALHRVARYQRQARIQNWWHAYNSFMLQRFFRPVSRFIYGPRLDIPIPERSWRDRLVMAIRISPLIFGVILEIVLTG